MLASKYGCTQRACDQQGHCADSVLRGHTWGLPDVVCQRWKPVAPSKCHCSVGWRARASGKLWEVVVS
eukprot:2076857-Alexandrium_andersonii.AAC.1